MRLCELSIRRMPGIDHEFTLDRLGPGLNLIVGANGAGKTTLCRAVRATLWPRAEEVPQAWVTAVWETASERLRSERDGRDVRWQRDGIDTAAPDLPDVRLARCFTLGMLDLLVGDETDEGIAREIRRQMAGGYDLDAVIDGSFRVAPRFGAGEAKRLGASERTLVQLRTAEKSLAQREEDLEELQRSLAAARAARANLGHLQTAAEHARARARLDAVRAARAPEDDVLQRLRGDELERLDELVRETDEVRQARVEVEEERATVEREMAALAMPGGPADLGTLNLALANVRELGRVEARLADTRKDEVRASGELEAVAAELDPGGRGRPGRARPGRGPRLGEPGREPSALAGPALESAAAQLRLAGELAARRATLEARLELLSAPAAPSEELPRLGAQALRDWLAASGRVDSATPVAGLVVALSAAALIVGAVLVRLSSALWIGVAGVGAGGLLAAGLLARWGQVERGRSARRFADLGLPPPPAWTRTAVIARARELDDDVARALRAREDEAEAKRLRAGEPELAQRETEAARRRDEIRAALGVDLSDLGAVVLAERMRAFDDAERRLWAAHHHREDLERQCRAQAEAAIAVLRAHGEAPPASPDAAPEDDRDDDRYTPVASTLEERLQGVKERSQRYKNAVAERERQTRELESLAAREERIAARSAELYGAVLLVSGDRDGLARLLERLEPYRRSVEEERLLERTVSELGVQLLVEPELLQMSPAAIEERLAAQAEVADRLEGSARQVQSIQDAIDQAHGGEAIDLALAARDAARDELSQCREAALAAAAGRFLVERVSARYEQQTRPEVLRLAQGWFAAFTHYAFELRLEGGERGASFRAVDTASGQGLSLSQLSDGTRMQLLLAVRLAFATTAERTSHLPIFLDDVLTTSDPQRFHAVAESVVRMVKEGDRQVFYLTCDPADIDRFAAILDERGMDPVVAIDLGAVRRGTVAITSPLTLVRPALPPVPVPDWRGAEAYAVAIGVPHLDPRRPLAAMHLFFLLRDDLQLLHRLLSARIETVGKWRAFARAGLASEGGASVLVSPHEAHSIDLGVFEAEIFFEAFRIGRGRPVDRAVLAASGVVTDRYLGELADLAAELGHDARALVAAIDERADPRVKGFRADKAEALRLDLAARGYLDERRTLELPEVEARLLAALAARGSGIDPARVARRVHDLWAAAGGGEGAG